MLGSGVLLVLCKRRPMGRDLLLDPYGRFFFLPRRLASRGYNVNIHLLNYKFSPSEEWKSDGISWRSSSLLAIGFPSFVSAVASSIKAVRPDMIIGFSDTYFGIFAILLGRWFNIPVLIDAYDNYESYLKHCKLLHWLWRYSIKSADIVTAAGPQLADYMRRTSGRAEIDVVPMAADPIFKPMDRVLCRSILKLQADVKMVGYIGSIYRNRGVEFLFDVIEAIRDRSGCSVEFVISGRLERGLKVPRGVTSLGYQPANRVPLLINSMDLLLSVNVPGSFGDYSYPVKIYEAMQSNVPILASDVPGSRWILRDHPECLAVPGSLDDYANKAAHLLSRGRIAYKNTTSWESSGELLYMLIDSNINSRRSGRGPQTNA